MNPVIYENKLGNSVLIKPEPRATKIENTNRNGKITPLSKQALKAICFVAPSVLAVAYVLSGKEVKKIDSIVDIPTIDQTVDRSSDVIIGSIFVLFSILLGSAVTSVAINGQKAAHKIGHLGDCTGFSSITGNPPTLGHMAMVASGIQKLTEEGYRVTRVQISLSGQGYLMGKVVSANKNASGTKKTALSQVERVHILRGTIDEANKRNMFGTTIVEYWNDQEDRSRDHPESYRELAAQSSTPVFFIAGEDNYSSMGGWSQEWSYIQNTVVVSRGKKSSLPSDSTPPEGPTRLFTHQRFPEFASLSSTKIQNRDGKTKLEPKALQKYFEDACNRTVNP